MTIPHIAAYSMPQLTDFPVNKTDWQINPDKAVLLVHDMQQYFLDFYDLSQEPMPQLLKHCQQLIAACHLANIPVVYTAQPGNQTPEHRQLLSDFWGKGLSNDPEIVRIIPALAPQPQDVVLTKWRYSAFKRTELEKLMQDTGRDQLMICGVYAHIGCLLSAAEAFMLDIQPFLIGNALADFSREEHDMALKYAASRCAQVIDTTTIINAIMAMSIAKPAEALFEIDHLRQQVAAQLNIESDEIEDDDNLLMLGLDSVQLMNLLGHWRKMGANIEFQDLAEEPTLAAWTQRLSIAA
ncbi:MAG: isochorismatase [Moraxellaceae bacterium]|nr:MAG: isochorismatase [Moraxellaceae bacterium]